MALWYKLLLIAIFVCACTHVLILMTVCAWVSVIGSPSCQFPKPIQNTLAPCPYTWPFTSKLTNCLTLGLVLWDTAPIILFLPKILAYYSSIITNSFRCLLFSKLCQHNLSKPICEPHAMTVATESENVWTTCTESIFKVGSVKLLSSVLYQTAFMAIFLYILTA